MADHLIEISILRRVLDYSPETGRFYRKAAYRNGKYCSGRGCGEEVFYRPNRKGYLRIELMGRRYFAHRLAWYHYYGEYPTKIIDHINGDKTDNRICNLRLATPMQNARNAKTYKTNTTGYKGVSPRPNGKFRAKIYIKRRQVHLGMYDTPEEAYAAYCEAAKRHFGEFANLA